MEKPGIRPVIGVLIATLLVLAGCGNPAPSASPPTGVSEETVEAQLSGRTDWRDEVLYFALTDRFANGNPANDNGANQKPGDAADKTNPLGWHGGDWAGIKQKIEEGYFQKLGFTAIWISPVVLQVPAIPVNDANSPNNGKLFAGYHGYWAEDFFKTDPHFGTLAELRDLVRTAHRHGLKIVQDMVVNHAGYNSGLLTQHPDWFNTPAACEASSNKDIDCPLAGLPDFNQNNPQVRQFLNDATRFWIRNTGIDGIRMDTMKHVADSYWPQFFAPGGPANANRIWTVGEVFNGDPAFLKRYLDFGSPSVFDFPLYFAVKDHLSSGGGSLEALGNVFAQDTAYAGQAWRLTTFVDNHDVPRFMSEAINRGVPEAQAKERLDMALSLIYFARGTPSVYYGSEIAMQGKGDPYNFPLGQSNREDMDFSKVPGSPLAVRLTKLAEARRKYPALTRGTQQELWRSSNVYAFRRVVGREDPVVIVLNNSDGAVELAGIPLLGTFEEDEKLKEVTGRSHNLRVDGGNLIGTVPPRTALAVTGDAGEGFGKNRRLGNAINLQTLAGDGAIRLSWTPASDPSVIGHRVYYKTGRTLVQVNFAPFPKTVTSAIVRGLTNGTAYELRVVSVDAQGRESVRAPTVTATPQPGVNATVNFTVDARSQGAATIEVRRFDTGSQLEYPLQPDPARPGFWTGSITVPLFREIKFKFGNDAPGAKNSGYEGSGQPDRALAVNEASVGYSGVYDYITAPIPNAAITGRVTSGSAPLTRALVDSGLDPNLNYAFTFSDGTYYLPFASGASTSLTASAVGYTASAPVNVTTPASNVNFNLVSASATKYTIDGNLSDWTTPRATLTSTCVGLFGPDNCWGSLWVDWDTTYLYLGYTYRAGGNSSILYLDVAPGGISAADGLDAWRRAAQFGTGVDFFLARYQDGGFQSSLELRKILSVTQTQALTSSDYQAASTGSSPAWTSEVAIPWTTLGYSGPPSATLNIYGGIFGGDGFGAGDIIPNPGSTPSGGNSVDTGNSFRAIFNAPFAVTVSP